MPISVVTDMRRTPADYTRMGLPIFDRTLHYRQWMGGCMPSISSDVGSRRAEEPFVAAVFLTMGSRATTRDQ